MQRRPGAAFDVLTDQADERAHDATEQPVAADGEVGGADAWVRGERPDGAAGSLKAALELAGEQEVREL